MLSLLLLQATLTPRSANDWVHVDCVRAAGSEKIGDGRPQPFSIVRSGDAFAVDFTRADGAGLAGLLRTELITPKGVFEWLAGDGRFVAQLPNTQVPEFVSSMLPSRFRPSEVASKPWALERATGRKIVNGDAQPVADRTCYVLSFSGRNGLAQSLWIDEETGMALRQVDTLQGQRIYERRLSSFEPVEQASLGEFSVPANSVLIKGLVSPEILSWATLPQTPGRLQADLASARSSSAIQAGGWILQPAIPANFSYMGTKHFERINPRLLQEGTIDSDSFGEIPLNWVSDVPKTVSHGLVFRFPTLSSPRPINLISVSAVLMGPDGSVYSTGSSQTADDGACGVRSEFLDPSTGDTITVFQTRNMPLIAVLEGARPVGLRSYSSPKWTDMKAFELHKPSSMNGVEWQAGGTHYVIVSSSLDAEKLRAIAETMVGVSQSALRDRGLLAGKRPQEAGSAG